MLCVSAFVARGSVCLSGLLLHCSPCRRLSREMQDADKAEKADWIFREEMWDTRAHSLDFMFGEALDACYAHLVMRTPIANMIGGFFFGGKGLSLSLVFASRGVSYSFPKRNSLRKSGPARRVIDLA